MSACYPKILPAEDRALQQYLADLPTPREYAEGMPASLALALLTAQRRNDGTALVDKPIAARLRPFGLCECRGCYLTNFGMSVLKALRELDRL